MADAPDKTATGPSKNCAGCNKPMKKIVKYYRNGKYYCNKKCWKNTQATAVQPAESSGETAAEPVAESGAEKKE